MKNLRPDRFAFTLLELLVVVGIIAVLAGVSMPVLQSIRQKSKMVKEINAARQLITAYIGYAAANDGELLTGYDKSVTQVQLVGGGTVSGEMCCRYPWRLAPYVGGQIEEIFLLNDNKKYTDGKAHDSFDYQYRASLNPALGLNSYCVGGFVDTSDPEAYTTDVVRRLGAAARPTRLLVFSSARMKTAGQEESAGNFLIIPPRLNKQKWTAAFDRTAASANFGNVDLRWSKKAVCTFLDGSVSLLSEAELRDSRIWSNTAAETDDMNYTVPK